MYYKLRLIYHLLNCSQCEFKTRSDVVFCVAPASSCGELKFVSPVNKQINDKERVAAAMENPNLREIVEQCVTEPDD